VAIVEDPEFSEFSLRIKKHPTLKVHFYSPTGDSDTKLNELPPHLQAEERAYRKFILGK